MLITGIVMDNEPVRNKIEEIYREYRKLLFYTAYSILKDYHEAEDVVHMAIIKVCEYLDKIDDIKCNKTKAFLVIIVRNIAINVYNKKRRLSDFSMERLFDSSDTNINPEEYMLKIENAEWVARKLASINPEYADVLVLRYTYQFSIEEIAYLLNTTEGNVRVKLHRARKALHEIMKGEYYENTKE
ncbi:sigma-70 family RNA polymerase sigma factor [Thermoclostridium stercorarium]|uniref:RNA polymerase sigma factor n=1 Tax=Thermoclostridium stercorarium TaxID=1510 RepID=UPI0022496690|nr:sigma-70 family RNA polymerase sigma factor [Thermoclostridium stercorarium]UZQ85499.1 sigma-70 family RNA polymerase sigma factor [Thermoclostridium stercorarium]